MRQGFALRADERESIQMGDNVHAAHMAVFGGERSNSWAAEIGSMMSMVPPQSGQRQFEHCSVAEPTLDGVACSVERGNSSKQMGSRLARRRLARKPKLRMRRKPRGSRCSRKRRRNSSTGKVISFFLLPWAESRQGKVTLPWWSATSLWLEMATRWV